MHHVLTPDARPDRRGLCPREEREQLGRGAAQLGRDLRRHQHTLDRDEGARGLARRAHLGQRDHAEGDALVQLAEEPRTVHRKERAARVEELGDERAGHVRRDDRVVILERVDEGERVARALAPQRRRSIRAFERAAEAEEPPAVEVEVRVLVHQPEAALFTVGEGHRRLYQRVRRARRLRAHLLEQVGAVVERHRLGRERQPVEPSS